MPYRARMRKPLAQPGGLISERAFSLVKRVFCAVSNSVTVLLDPGRMPGSSLDRLPEIHIIALSKSNSKRCEVCYFLVVY